jgi:hypothetical protein
MLLVVIERWLWSSVKLEAYRESDEAPSGIGRSAQIFDDGDFGQDLEFTLHIHVVSSSFFYVDSSDPSSPAYLSALGLLVSRIVEMMDIVPVICSSMA